MFQFYLNKVILESMLSVVGTYFTITLMKMFFNTWNYDHKGRVLCFLSPQPRQRSALNIIMV